MKRWNRNVFMKNFTSKMENEIRKSYLIWIWSFWISKKHNGRILSIKEMAKFWCWNGNISFFRFCQMWSSIHSTKLISSILDFFFFFQVSAKQINSFQFSAIRIRRQNAWTSTDMDIKHQNYRKKYQRNLKCIYNFL